MQPFVAVESSFQKVYLFGPSVLNFNMIPAERLQKALEEFFGLNKFRPGQLEVVTSVINGFDTLAVMPTGGGKSICYQLPGVLSDGLTIVITPLVSLMKDQVAQVNRFGRIATQLDSSLDLDEIRSRLQLVRTGGVKLLYVAPERLETRRFIESISKTRVSHIAVDEAHCISQWGHDFRPHYTRISEFAGAVGNPVILALTATATPDVQDDIIAQLKMRSPRVYIRGFRRDNLSFQVLVEKAKTTSVLNYVSANKGSGIIYAATRKSVDEIHDLLVTKGIKALHYHAGLTERERTSSQAEFISSNRVMVATNAFGMGINKPDVRYVIHYEIPGTLEAYYQEAGRAGRDGKLAECLLLFNKKDLAVQEFFINTLYPSREDFIRVYTAIFDKLAIAVGSIPEEYLTISTQEISLLTKLNPRIIDSVFRILSQRELIQLMPNISASAYVRSRVDMASYRRAIEKTSSNDSKAVLESILRLHGNAVFSEEKPLRMDEVAQKAGIGPSNVIRTLAILHRSGLIEYKPPTEGVTFRMRTRREKPESIPIDFNNYSQLRERATERLSRTKEFATNTGCRTNYILNYFGEDPIEGGCGNCDNCTVTSEYASLDVKGLTPLKEIHRAILSLVNAANGEYGRTTCCKILLGNGDKGKTDPALSEEHFGVLKGVPAQVVYSAFDLLMSRKYIAKNGFVYPTVIITDEGGSYLRTGIAPAVSKPFILRKALYKALRDERRALASELSLPAFAICSDDKLIEIANTHPLKEENVVELLSRDGAKSGVISKRMLQVCLDFSSESSTEMSQMERSIYELYLEKLTAGEIAVALSTTVQGVIETLEKLQQRGLGVDLRTLIGTRKFALLESELRKTADTAKVRESIRDCEIAEVQLVARLTGVSV